MSWFLNPTGHATYGIGICARCQQKFFIDELFDDPNVPGLKVCRDDIDQLDPYRLPPRPPDPLTLLFTRPDVPVTNPNPINPGDPGWPPADATTTDGSNTVAGT